VLAALSAMHARVLGESAPLEITLLEGPLSREEWRRLGALLTCRVRATS
jgi:hypothetical protein